MNWPQVFHDAEMENLFGAKPIPSVYLVDDTGTIVFSSWEQKLSALNEILEAKGE